MTLSNKLQNRRKWKHGFSLCGQCQKMLMYELSKGRALDEVITLLKERHPTIKDIRRYSMNAIRQTTGEGIFDDYIVEHDLWNVREPLFAPDNIRESLEVWWTEAAADGEKIVNYRREIEEIDKEHPGVLSYLISTTRSPTA